MTDNWDLLGHDWAVGMLQEHLAQDAVRHAYLFSGPPAVGKRTLALRFSQALLCSKPRAPGQPCRSCRTCKQIEAMQYPDLTVVQAEVEGGVLRVEPVRAVRQSLVLKPFQGQYRVALFLRFQEANANAANALLKTLEEAPSHALLILTADTPDQLLPTILSRCEVLRLRPLPVEALESALLQRGAAPETAHLLAHLSSGRPGYALRQMQDPQELEFRRKLLEDLSQLLGASRRARFTFAERLTNKKRADAEQVRETLSLWLSFWRDVLLAASGSGTPLVNVDHSDEIQSLARQLSFGRARRLVAQAEAALEQLEKNVNPRLLVEVLLLDWPKRP